MIRRIALFMLCSYAAAFAQTTTFTANLKDLGINTPTAYVELTLKNCAGSGATPTIPHVNGVGVVTFPVQLYPVAGAISTTVYDETFIVCGSSAGVSYYHIAIYQGDSTRSLVKKLLFADDFDVQGASFNLNSATPRSGSVITPPPATAVLTNPVGNQTVVQPVGTSLTINRLSATFAQNANGADMISGNRFTDTSPTGNFLNFLNAAGNASLWQVDVSGNLLAGTVPAARTTGLSGTGSCTNQFVAALNAAASPTCANSLGGELTTAAYNTSTHNARETFIQNSDFEGTSIIPPPGWATAGAATTSYETVSPAPNKLQSLKLSTTAQFGAIRTVTNFSAVPGDPYTLTCAAKSDGKGAAVCGVFCFNSANGSTGQTLSSSTTSTSWSTLSVNVTIPASTDYCRVVGENTSATQPSAVWFDQFNIRLNSFAGIVNAPGYKGPEAAAPAGIASFDLLYPDSTAHRWKMINNNGTATQVVASGADINTSDQVTVTHLASPLPTAQGGTAQNSTATFPASGVVVTGTGTSNKLPKFITGASGIVGDSSITDNGTAVSSSEPFTLITNHQIFTGNGTFTIPAGVTAVKVTVVGAGGAGGGGTAGGVNGGGGGSGGAGIKWLTGLTPGNTLAVTIGAGGTGNAGLAGNNGNASSVASGTQTITTITANGGGGGASNSTQSNGGSGATAGSGGDLNFGGNAGIGGANGTSGGGAGSILGGGAGPIGNSNGIAAAANSGAGGGGAGQGASNTGGAGGSGIVIFEWTN